MNLFRLAFLLFIAFLAINCVDSQLEDRIDDDSKRKLKKHKKTLKSHNHKKAKRRPSSNVVQRPSSFSGVPNNGEQHSYILDSLSASANGENGAAGSGTGFGMFENIFHMPMQILTQMLGQMGPGSNGEPSLPAIAPVPTGNELNNYDSNNGKPMTMPSMQAKPYQPPEQTPRPIVSRPDIDEDDDDEIKRKLKPKLKQPVKHKKYF